MVGSGSRCGQGAQPAEGCGERSCPAPVAVDLEPEFAAPAHESGGDVQQSVAQRLRFGAGQARVVVEQDGLSPGDEVDRGQRAGEPGLVDRELAGWESAQAGVFAASDAVLDSGVAAVAGVEPGVVSVAKQV
jgi:hypothetical protein